MPIRFIDSDDLAQAVAMATADAQAATITVGEAADLLTDMVSAVQTTDARTERQILVDIISLHIRKFYPTQPLTAEELAP